MLLLEDSLPPLEATDSLAELGSKPTHRAGMPKVKTIQPRMEVPTRMAGDQWQKKHTNGGTHRRAHMFQVVYCPKEGGAR